MRILVADDDLKLLEVVRAILERAGHDILEAKDGEEALRLIRDQVPDLVLSDIFMPGGDGVELILALREEFPDMIIISMSGGGFGGKLDMLPAAKRLGAIEILHKPFNQVTLLATIELAQRFHGSGNGRGSQG